MTKMIPCASKVENQPLCQREIAACPFFYFFRDAYLKEPCDQEAKWHHRKRSKGSATSKGVEQLLSLLRLLPWWLGMPQRILLSSEISRNKAKGETAIAIATIPFAPFGTSVQDDLDETCPYHLPTTITTVFRYRGDGHCVEFKGSPLLVPMLFASISQTKFCSYSVCCLNHYCLRQALRLWDGDNHGAFCL